METYDHEIILTGSIILIHKEIIKTSVFIFFISLHTNSNKECYLFRFTLRKNKINLNAEI